MLLPPPEDPEASAAIAASTGAEKGVAEEAAVGVAEADEGEGAEAEEGEDRPPPPPGALVAEALGAAVAAVQVQDYLPLCTKKSRDWVAVEAYFNPLGVA